uniref:Uncharacterized protein n=1 Tax=Arundo donax TaxID=35708 RepID=A0A0A9FAV1_ARUDO
MIWPLCCRPVPFKTSVKDFLLLYSEN